MSQQSKRYYSFTVIFFLVLFYAINNFIWLKLDEFPPFAGQAYHLLRGLEYSQIFKSHSVDMFSRMLKVDNLRPPLFHFCLGIGNIVLKPPIVAYAFINIVFAGILFLCVYHIGRLVYGRLAGLLSAFILAMYPYVFGLSRMAKTYLASMALICAAVYFLLSCDSFKKRSASIYAGTFIGLSALTRLQFIFFIIGPFITVTASAFFSKQNISRKKIAVNLVLSLTAAALTAGIWYLPRMPDLLKTYLYYGYSTNLPPEFSPKIFSTSSLVFYLKGFINGQASPFFSVFFLLGFLTALRKNKLNPVFISWIIASYLILTMIKCKEFRMISEYLPAFALITAGGILSLERRWLKHFFVSMIIIGGLAQYFLTSFTNPLSTHIRLSFFNGKLTQGWVVPSYFYPLSEVYYHYPRKGNWQTERIVYAIAREQIRGKVEIGCTDAYLDVKTDWFDPFRLETWHENFIPANCDALNYTFRAYGLPYNVISLSYWQEDWRSKPLLDFIVSVKEAEKLIPSIADQYKLVFKAELPDRSCIFLYKRKFLENENSFPLPKV